MTQSQINQNKNSGLSEKAKQNLEAVSLKLQTTSKYFRLDATQSAVIHINPEDKIEEVENERFATTDPKTGEIKVPIRFEFKITHPNTGDQQLWTVSKTVAIQLISLLNQGYTTMKVTRIGTGKQTNYLIEGLQ